jgi:hypothetical protein
MSGIATFLVWHRVHREDEGDIGVGVIASRNKDHHLARRGRARENIGIGVNTACEFYRLCVEGESVRSA